MVRKLSTSARNTTQRLYPERKMLHPMMTSTGLPAMDMTLRYLAPSTLSHHFNRNGRSVIPMFPTIIHLRLRLRLRRRRHSMNLLLALHTKKVLNVHARLPRKSRFGVRIVLPPHCQMMTTPRFVQERGQTVGGEIRASEADGIKMTKQTDPIRRAIHISCK
ncbi:hypothetical protein K469DRAFT_122978 [Zopfia rhizophila CBS 207.26]|uniref:Uncharacterized protein n=1 Tax=Zopfia rhizophila CBS 207.26 TaxID=1314779 RepID=A0A6A6E5I2_9PEZI|nr:hypothetical protein K469DRAFT_122978 [Zopfia rhizophila CBS 207.26]